MVATGTRLALACAALTGCSFGPAAVPGDGPVDVPLDVVDIPATCASIHTAMPSAPSGPYTIDPDGEGPSLPIVVTCDMTTDGGGWTIVFFPASINVSGSPTWTSATPRLLSDAVQVLVAYRNATQTTVVGDRALFAMPPEWRVKAPFLYDAVDLITSVSINGANATPRTVRYGTQNFGFMCSDGWVTNMGPYGRFCIVGTTAAFYTGFSVSASDTCAESTQQWDANVCMPDRRFSIALR